jgi:pimeloyl-ACP methyl ester carboxylesterase
VGAWVSAPGGDSGACRGTLAMTDERLGRTVALADGRTLGYAEYGSPEAPVVMLFHGVPGSRLDAPEFWAAEPEGARVIAPDRPGFGLSTFQPGRRMTAWASDVAALADELGIGQFRVLGFSGGGPYALAAAHGLPDRVLASAVVSGGGPVESKDSLAGMNRVNRLIFGLARVAPATLRPLVALQARGMKRRPEKILDQAAHDKHLPQADREVFADPRVRELMITAGPEAFRQGGRAVVQEVSLIARPWGFDPATIKPPVLIWHGEADTNVPVALAQAVAGRIPGCRLETYPGEGHFIVPKHWDEILSALLAAGS